MTHMKRSAIISKCGKYRYRLERELGGAGKTAAVLMVNPSTADGLIDDASIRKLLGFSSRLNFSRLIVGNKFAYRATNINELRDAKDAVGPENDRHIERIIRDADYHIVAWGRLGKLPIHLRDRWREVSAITKKVGCELFCFGVTADGHPSHPLMLGYSRRLVRWTQPN